MSRSFSSIADFVAFMERKVAALPQVQRRALGRATAVVLAEARSYPGSYQNGWPALKPSTINHKATGDSPLLETGEMRESYRRRVVSPTFAAVGSDDVKAIWHETGTSRTPPRPVLATAAIAKEGEVRRIIGQAVFGHLTR